MGSTKAENGLGITKSEEAHADCAIETQVALYLACLYALQSRQEDSRNSSKRERNVYEGGQGVERVSMKKKGELLSGAVRWFIR